MRYEESGAQGRSTFVILSRWKKKKINLPSAPVLLATRVSDALGTGPRFAL